MSWGRPENTGVNTDGRTDRESRDGMRAPKCLRRSLRNFVARLRNVLVGALPYLLPILVRLHGQLSARRFWADDARFVCLFARARTRRGRAWGPDLRHKRSHVSDEKATVDAMKP